MLKFSFTEIYNYLRGNLIPTRLHENLFACVEGGCNRMQIHWSCFTDIEILLCKYTERSHNRRIIVLNLNDPTEYTQI
jgi:hypothetical protein